VSAYHGPPREGPDLTEWVTRGDVVRHLRAELAPGGARVAVVLAPGVIPPELVNVARSGADLWRTVAGLNVAALPRDTAVMLAAGRSRAAGVHIARPPADGCAWVLLLLPNGCQTWGFPLTAGTPLPSAGDA
jgi:hypothetical protein